MSLLFFCLSALKVDTEQRSVFVSPCFVDPANGGQFLCLFSCFRRAAEQLIGLPDATPDEEQQAAELDFAQQQQQQQQGGAPDLWLKGRVAVATAWMDVGEIGCRMLFCPWLQRRQHRSDDTNGSAM